MSITRRSVIVQGGVIGAGLLASGLPGMKAFAQIPPVPWRRSLQGLAWNDPIVATYRDAVRLLKAASPGEKFTWIKLSEIHGSDAGFKYCPHGNWYFLPWHRAYTAMYERIVRQVTKNNDFAMPFWDWTANPYLPEVFTMQKTPDGKDNSLYVPTRTWPSTRPMPPQIVGPDVLKAILAATPFEVFGTSRPRGQNSLDPSWIVGGGGTQGILEATPHNQVHNNIGGFMPTASSPRDPIFFMHHGNIDRIWATWNLRNGNSNDPLWTNMPFNQNFYNVDGSFWSPKVSDLYVPEELGYTYGFRNYFKVATASAKTLALDDKLSSVIAATAPEVAVAGLTTVSADNSKAATTNAPLSLPIKLPAGALQSIVSQPPLPSGMDMMDFGAAQEQAASTPRVLAFLRDVEITDPKTTSVLVFLGKRDLTADTPVTDPHYVGSFAVLDHSGEHHGAHGHRPPPSFVLDLTDAIQRVYGAGNADAEAIDLQLVPVGAGQGKPGSAKPARLEIAIVAA
ncbi:monooxygenase [Rhizobium sp. P38BS-XIX]|uniref:tyrosinase family protein n=1 Tax=Rhizobium sp. P38BS-XIX TaxID=2726740 RepID=UPI0014566D9F|nr:tyrosinase family protein [Rhizobium sp. P38BS-XIX]NLR98035.1 monooxygenase [Rhizobium sp. P38BS-XIX]